MTDQATQPARRSVFAGLLVDAAWIGGAGLVIHGVSLVNGPAAYIVAGGFVLAGAWLLARKGV